MSPSTNELSVQLHVLYMINHWVWYIAIFADAAGSVYWSQIMSIEAITKYYPNSHLIFQILHDQDLV